MPAIRRFVLRDFEGTTLGQLSVVDPTQHAREGPNQREVWETPQRILNPKVSRKLEQ
jgi:hypothetical protein